MVSLVCSPLKSLGTHPDHHGWVANYIQKNLSRLSAGRAHTHRSIDAHHSVLLPVFPLYQQPLLFFARERLLSQPSFSKAKSL
jgi:hypothetical protein